MKIIRILMLGIVVVSGMFFIAPLSKVFAVDVVAPVCNNIPAGGEVPAVCKDNNTGGSNPIIGPDGVLTTYIRILSFAIGVIAVGAIILGGIRFITSNGDPQTVSAAQKTVIFAVVGLVVAALSQALVIFVLSKV